MSSVLRLRKLQFLSLFLICFWASYQLQVRIQDHWQYVWGWRLQVVWSYKVSCRVVFLWASIPLQRTFWIFAWKVWPKAFLQGPIVSFHSDLYHLPQFFPELHCRVYLPYNQWKIPFFFHYEVQFPDVVVSGPKEVISQVLFFHS